MNSKDLALLERAFVAEIASAINGSPRVMQTRSKRVGALVAEGYLAPYVQVWRGIKIDGFELTHAGRFAYCVTREGAAE